MYKDINDAINVMKRKYDRIEKLNGSTGEYHSEYDRQIIEWLEELKTLRYCKDAWNNKNTELFREIFLNELINQSVNREEAIMYRNICNMAWDKFVEQLKESKE